ncbi:MarR family winged helix-turn-helix transcriptional regulator [Oenococcus kitaharae]|uniref:MarR family transcriptional regulator n=1 Tax=Oenococcus kitaharae DSM 17330 TaxID=1045004 RepID=G9WFU1_9LACO|nr:MarR family transcriptional regulator [Oenococcus kitaharae]EHN59464.1 MarR family transcriptional regulator [Oenococcus kitaharae DSM 17330]MCV3295868.1 MarR family transcriptional regulator [Oenococcus kitaharae]OEY83329.1 MarR family transcriptional regulator [Oenococcus kitaharae]OEY85127.1 MarR family transcriptional regulator [Oenococcus kitaharae]OEY85982.1 MarR family transcriptional regulator [Oenococcus kitaharae]
MKTALESLRNADALYTEKLVKLMKSFGLTIAEHRLLLLIESGLDTQEKISQATSLDTSTLSRQLKSAVNKDLLDKIATGRDKRQLIYSVTERGLDDVKKIAAELARLDAAAFENWNQNDRSLLEQLLEKLENSF